MSESLADQVVLITGASAGIGAALAELLAQRYLGIRLVLAARRGDRLEQVATRCRKAGAEVLVVPTDMADLDQVRQLAAQTLATFGRVDALVSNAGYGQMGPLELMPSDAVRRQFEVNFFGAVALMQAVIPAMRTQGGGRMVTVSSIAGRIPFPMAGLYSSSKFALEAVNDVLRMELSPFNIQVSVVEPGPVETEFVAVAQWEVAQTIAQPQNTPYRAAFEQLGQLDQKVSQGAWTAERTAEVVIQALSDRTPRPRYIAATGGNFLVFLMTKLLPTGIVDNFWKRFYGIDRVVKDWRTHRRP